MRIWRPLVFRNQIYGWRDVHQGRGQLSKSLLSYPPSDYELENNLAYHCGRKASKRASEQAASKQASKAKAKPKQSQSKAKASSKQEAAGKKQQARSSRQEAAGKKQQARSSSSSKQQQAAGQQPAFAPWKE